jgi:hypothetical protein
MADDSGATPLPRRVPGATVSPRPPVRVERLVIPEDLRQRLLTAIADELQRDEAQAGRSAQEQGNTEKLAIPGDRGTAWWRDEAAAQAGGEASAEGAAAGALVAQAGTLPAGPEQAAAPDQAEPQAPAPDPAEHQAVASGQADLPAPAPDQAASAPTVWSPVPRSADVPAPASDQASASAPTIWSPIPRPAGVPVPVSDQASASAPTIWSPVPRPAGIPPTAPDHPVRRALSADQADVPPPAADRPDPQPVAPLPRRAPGTNGAPPPPAHVRRNFLPPSLLGRRLDRDAYTEPLPRITGIRAGSFAALDDAHRAADPVVAPTPPAGAPPLVPTPPDSAPSGSGEVGDAPPDREPAAPAPPGAGPSGPAGPDAGPSEPEGAGQGVPLSEPSLPATPSALAVTAAPPVAPPGFAQVSPPPAALASPTAPAAPRPAGQASPAFSTPRGSPRYTWPDRNEKQPGDGAVVPTPAASSADKKQQTSGRRYRIAGLLVAVIALVIAAVIVLLLSGRTGAAGKSQGGLGPPGAGTGERNLAAAWVARQVSRTAVVACDPVMCNALAAHGVPARVLNPLRPGTTSPLHSEIIVATAQVRAQFGHLLSSGYAPAVLARFGSGPQRIEIRQIAEHGAVAYQAMLGADLLRRKTSGAELLRSNRIATAPIARQELSAGRVDSRLLIAIAQMASVHPMYIINFGSAAPGADPDLPLRFADLAETGRAHLPYARSVGYVRSMVSLLRTQHIPFRPAHEVTVYLAGGRKALRIEFPAPSPLGLLGPRRA